jgi:hypothetical protein
MRYGRSSGLAAIGPVRALVDGMTRTLLSTLGALALATSLGAQQPSPATQPVRPPVRPPSGEPQPPLQAPAPDLGARSKKGGDGESRTSGEPEAGTLTLKGCLQRVGSPAVFRLHHVEGDDATVTADVRLTGDLEQLRDHVGRIVEARGRYEQDTPATTTPASFGVTRVKALAGTCPAK